MSQVWEYIKIALMNIRSNKGRSVLTMLGIIIGISSVIMIISVGNGIKSEVNGELNDMAGGQVAIYTDMQQNQEEQVFFSEEDFDAIQEKVAHVKSVTPVYNVYGSTSTRKGSFDIMLSCGTAGLKDYSKDPIIKGHFFTENDYYGAKKVCVIPESTARTLFGTTDVVGMTLNLDIDGISQEFEVIGIRQDSSAALINMTSGGMQSMEIPLSTLETFGYYVSDFSDFYIIGESNEYTSKIAKDSVSLLEKRHNVRGKGIILVQSFNDALAQVNSVLNYITIFVVLVAAISLLVGGIGIMNIMLVSVTERTREIGIRKALGAREGIILRQFVIEAATTSALGGGLGIILGYLMSAVATQVIKRLMETAITVSPSATAVLAAFGISAGIGILFGYLPAKRAARLDPIEALRYD